MSKIYEAEILSENTNVQNLTPAELAAKVAKNAASLANAASGAAAAGIDAIGKATTKANEECAQTTRKTVDAMPKAETNASKEHLEYERQRQETLDRIHKRDENHTTGRVAIAATTTLGIVGILAWLLGRNNKSK